MRGRKKTAAVFCMLGISFLICACGKENGIGKDGPANAGTSEADNVGEQDISDTGTKKEKMPRVWKILSGMVLPKRVR